MKKLRAVWQSLWVDVDRRVRLGRILGLLFVVAGFVVIGVAWNGSAGQVRVDSQFPYLLSGGFMGIGLIVVGVVMLLLATVRAEREILTEKFDEMNRLLSRNLGRLQVSASTAQTNGSSSVNHPGLVPFPRPTKACSKAGFREARISFTRSSYRRI